VAHAPGLGLHPSPSRCLLQRSSSGGVSVRASRRGVLARSTVAPAGAMLSTLLG